MDSFSIPEWIAIIALIVSALSAVFSGIAARAAANQVKLMKEEAGKRDRPYIFGYLQPHEGTNMIMFGLQNTGNAPAIDVVAEIDGPSPNTIMDIPLAEASLFKSPIKFFPAGAKYEHGVGTGKNLFEGEKAPKFKLKLSYKSISGQVLTDEIELDLEPLRNTTNAGPPWLTTLRDVNRNLEGIKGILSR